ncbi:hypothetical protein DH09_06010 [Bacillaceae bacterium JMAK1]|nr:hypothetical protein DH09_06010 [Bacillaceae bacterium JMAK1]
MKSILVYFISMAFIIHVVMDSFDGAYWLHRFVNLGFLFAMAAFIHLLDTEIKERRNKREQNAA